MSQDFEAHLKPARASFLSALTALSWEIVTYPTPYSGVESR
ncbi:MAG: hypothetical protein AAGI36_16995 [Pseudomonadota bacterium]